MPPLRAVLFGGLGRSGRTSCVSVAGRRHDSRAPPRRPGPPAVWRRSSSTPDLPDGAGAILQRTDDGRVRILRTRVATVHRPSRPGRAGARGHLPSLSARGGAGCAWHVRQPVALLSDGGLDAVSRRRAARRSSATRPRFRRRLRRPDDRPRRPASAAAPDDADGSRRLFGVGGAHGGAMCGGGAGSRVGAGDASARCRGGARVAPGTSRSLGEAVAALPPG